MKSDTIKLLLIVGLMLSVIHIVYSATPYRCGDMVYGELDNPPCNTNTSYFNTTGTFKWIGEDTYNKTGLDYSGTYKSTGVIRTSDNPSYFWYYYPNTSTTTYDYYGHAWESIFNIEGTARRITTYYTLEHSTLVDTKKEYVIYQHYMYNVSGLEAIDKAWLFQKISSGSNTIKEWWTVECGAGYSGTVSVTYALQQHYFYQGGYHWCPGQYVEQFTGGSRICNTTLMNRRFVAFWNDSAVGSNSLVYVVSWDSNETKPDLFYDYGNAIAGSNKGIYLIRPYWKGTCTASQNVTFPPIYLKSYNITSFDNTDSDGDTVPDQVENIIDLYYPTQHACGDEPATDYFYNGSLSNSSYFCQGGIYTNQTLDANQTLCSYYNYIFLNSPVNIHPYDPDEGFTAYSLGESIRNGKGWNNWNSTGTTTGAGVYNFTVVNSSRGYFNKTSTETPASYPIYTFGTSCNGPGSYGFTINSQVSSDYPYFFTLTGDWSWSNVLQDSQF